MLHRRCLGQWSAGIWHTLNESIPGSAVYMYIYWGAIAFQYPAVACVARGPHMCLQTDGFGSKSRLATWRCAESISSCGFARWV